MLFITHKLQFSFTDIKKLLSVFFLIILLLFTLDTKAQKKDYESLNHREDYHGQLLNFLKVYPNHALAHYDIAIIYEDRMKSLADYSSPSIVELAQKAMNHFEKASEHIDKKFIKNYKNHFISILNSEQISQFDYLFHISKKTLFIQEYLSELATINKLETYYANIYKKYNTQYKNFIKPYKEELDLVFVDNKDIDYQLSDLVELGDSVIYFSTEFQKLLNNRLNGKFKRNVSVINSCTNASANKQVRVYNCWINTIIKKRKNDFFQFKMELYRTDDVLKKTLKRLTNYQLVNHDVYDKEFCLATLDKLKKMDKNSILIDLIKYKINKSDYLISEIKLSRLPKTQYAKRILLAEETKLKSYKLRELLNKVELTSEGLKRYSVFIESSFGGEAGVEKYLIMETLYVNQAIRKCEKRLK